MSRGRDVGRTVEPSAYAEFYASDPTYGAFPQERRCPCAAARTGAVPVEFLRVEQGEADAVDPALPILSLALVTEAAPGFEARFHCGDGWFGGPTTAGQICVSPAEANLHCRLTGPHTILCAPLPLAPLAAALEREPAALARALEPLHRALHRDPLVEQLMRACWREAAREDPAATLMVEQGVLMLGAALLSRAGAEAEAAPPRLDDRRLARAVDHAEAHLAEPLTLEDMAAAACLSPFHFLRVFRDATGATPAAWVRARRVERARRLLAGPMPLAEIALATGFASQSHFGQVFREHVGATPGAYRREVRG